MTTTWTQGSTRYDGRRLIEDCEARRIAWRERDTRLLENGASEDEWRPGPALLVKVDDAARLLGIGRTTMFQLIAAGEVPTVRLGKRRLVVRAGLERFVERLID